MRTSFALLVLAGSLALLGCGDDTTQPGVDLSVVRDLSTTGGPTCADYCAKVQMNCTAVDGGSNAQYPSTTACETYCSMVAAWPAGVTGATTGNTVACRSYHAGAAAADPVTHCPHAGPTGGMMCGTLCENYCYLMAKNCTGANAVYDPATCATKCATIPTGGLANDTSGNTVQCRITYLGLAFSDATTNCPNAKIANDNPNGLCK
jgi:hypothetical protein